MMAVVTELQAELLAALLNSGVSSDTIIQALKVGERQARPECPKLEKLVNGANEEGTTPSYAAPTAAAVSNAIGSTDQRDGINASPLADHETTRQTIAEQLMRNDPWQSAKIIKQYMQQHNIPQREAVETTGLNQSHLSQHLNKGTPMKTQKRMTLYKWFEAKQREVAAQYNSTSGKRLAEHDLNSSPFTGASSYKRSRRNRFKWGQASTEILYQAYESQRNPSKDEREALVQACNRAECEQRGIPLEQVDNLGPNLVTESRVYNWFANRRKEEAFKVKLAMDAGTYSVSVVGPGGTEISSSSDTKGTSGSDSVTLATRSSLPIMVTPNKIPIAPHPEPELSPRTPVARLPTMSLIKCEQPQATTQTPTLPQVPYTHQIPAQNTSTVLQRPISVAFGTMPPQILTPTQLQVITGLMPGQMVPISHAGTNIVGQSGEVATTGALPPGHVTNLMLPGQLGAQPIPMHAVTLMSMTGGTSQVFYSMPGHSPVVPVSLATASSTQLPVTSHVPITVTANSLSTAPAIQLSAQDAVTESSLRRQSPHQLPQISSVQGANTQLQLTGTGSTPLPNQVYTQMVLPVASIPGQTQSTPTSIVRPPQMTKADVTRFQAAPAMQLPSISQLGTTPTCVQTPTTTTAYVRVPGLRQESASEELKRLGSLSADDTLVVEMKPVVQVVKSVEEGPRGCDEVAGGRDVVPEDNEEKVEEGNFKEPTLTLSEEGVVNIENGENNGTSAGASTVHMVVASGE